MACESEVKKIDGVKTEEVPVADSQLSRIITAIDYLVEHGWKDYMAAALVGCMMAESAVNPSAVNKGEKSGTLKSSGACNKGSEYGDKGSPWDYGAGLIQWTFVSRKENALIWGGVALDKNEAKGLITGRGIESVTLEKQLDMILGELRNGYKYANELITKCSTLKDSLAVIYCGYIGGTIKKENRGKIPTEEDIAKLGSAYDRANGKKLNSFNKRLNNAQTALDKYRESKA